MFTLVAATLLLVLVAAFANDGFHPGAVWLDTDGKPIQAHGGGILVHSNVYYWYGEDRTPGIRSAVSCYSSSNLLDWKRENTALWQTNLPVVNGRRTFVERPKVIYNPHTKQFVMWVHLEQGGYRYSRAGIATSDSPAGPFTFLKAIRPVANTNDFATLDPDPTFEKDFGGMFRDMNLFVDDDGNAYVFYAAEDNWTMYVTQLNDDFTGPKIPAAEHKTWARILVRAHREGPAPFKWKGKYYLITSACTGWAPNAANYSTADSILGPWKIFSNPCIGTNADTTFGAQSTFILPAPGRPDSFIFMADRWNPKNLPDSRYIWLPFTMEPGGKFTISWRDGWSLSPFDKDVNPTAKNLN
jgi:Glycosyl hydrolases family 43